MLLGLAGWFVGYDGSFEFEKIGDNYTTNHVPYVGMRALPALFGSLTVPVVFAIMKETGFPTAIATFTAALIAFGRLRRAVTFLGIILIILRFPDNAHITQTRLILLDAPLIFFMGLTLLSYVKFRKYRYSYVSSFEVVIHHILIGFRSEYTVPWWTWLMSTGLFLACTLGCKMVGLFTFMTIGTAVVIDLWDLLDHKKGLSMVSSIWEHMLLSYSDIFDH